MDNKQTDKDDKLQHIIHSNPNSLIYDGDCPLCKRFVIYTYFRNNIPNFKLINARENAQLVQELLELNLDLNKGMVFIYNNQLYYNDKSVHELAKLVKRESFFNKLFHAVFRHKFLAWMFYPLLKAGRRVALKIKGISLIE